MCVFLSGILVEMSWIFKTQDRFDLLTSSGVLLWTIQSHVSQDIHSNSNSAARNPTQILSVSRTTLQKREIFYESTTALGYTVVLLTPHISMGLRKTGPSEPPRHPRYCFCWFATICTFEIADVGSLLFTVCGIFRPEYWVVNFTLLEIMKTNATNMVLVRGGW